MNDEDSQEIKTILVGMSGTGKTNIINAMTNQPFDSNKISTLTSTFIEKVIEINKKQYRIELWDTAGQEKYKSLTKIFLKDSKIVIFVYDITTQESFEEVNYWVTTVKEILGEEPVYGLVGNKKDLYMNEEIDEDTGRNKANEIGALFKLTSAKTERGAINDYLVELLEEYLRRNGENIKVQPRRQTIESSLSINYSKRRDKSSQSSKCCT
jgi:small GTP-binding protein